MTAGRYNPSFQCYAGLARDRDGEAWQEGASGENGKERRRAMTLEPLLAHIVTRLFAEIGPAADRVRTGSLARPIERWSGADMPLFLDRLRKETGDDYMGLGASPCAPGASAFIIDLTSRCSTLRDAITESFRFSAMVTQALDFRLVERDDSAIIEIRRAPASGGSTGAVADLLVDWQMITWHKLPQRLIGSQIWLDRIEFDHGLDAPYAAYSAMFGPDCLFNGDACRLGFARATLDRRVVLRPQDARLLTSTASDIFARPRGLATNWKQTLAARLHADIASGHPPSSIDDLAAEFHVSSQTLRRRLRAEGISYRDLKAAARLEAARDALARQGATVQEASFAAGFADPGGLGRALRATCGPSPRELRDQLSAWVKGAGELH